ncbi:DNA-directed RNA polymerase subunit beta [Candidatus Clavichlamydia salmonicola]|uniref:DNA-directed RNA polymerase subunit beta n=1 Tax=Candidatus Clavichlamydia salmonicola TaxID=469812 RepID=UPI001891A76E|nr:DNA-directed RNA polymerase subunit beta [Candidatus Clavichlamydia salmonicola]
MKRWPERVSFTTKEDTLDLPNLIEIQIKSYSQFLQADRFPEEREKIGLQEVFQEIFPIKSYNEATVLEFLSYNLGVPKYSPEESIRRGISYNVTLKVRFRLTDETGIKEEEVYMGTIPLMTDKGTFIINGAERVVVSQVHRSPGISFEQERHPKGVMLFSFRIIPYRGSWLEALFDINDLVYIYVDRKKRRRKILATTFIRALGYSSDADIIEEFFNVVSKPLTGEKDFADLVGMILADNVVNEGDSGLVFGKAGEKMSTAMLKRMLDGGIRSVKIAEGIDETHSVIKMLVKDPTDSCEAALKDFYRKIRPGEPATLSNARSAVMRLFFDPKRYNLGRVGRYKLNRKLGFTIDDATLTNETLLKEDVIGALKYLINLKMGNGNAKVDDIDHLANRRVRSVGELIQNQCRVGLSRMEKIVRERINLFDFSSDTLTPGKIVSAKGLASVLKDFFGRSQLSQFMDQTNPVAELTHKRRISALGPGGLNRERAGFEVRDVHSSHYGRICPIETPEGPNIGLITSLSAFAKINEFGFIETPYRVVKDGIVTEEIEYMAADSEENCVIAQASAKLENNMFAEEICWARSQGEAYEADTNTITHMDVSPKQLVSIVTGLIPFLEHDDANRALMGSNMQRQAVPLLKTEAPIVGTGLEGRAAKDSGALLINEKECVVEYVDGFQIVVASKHNLLEKTTYNLKKFIRSNSGTCINQQPLCEVGDVLSYGDVIADGPATDKGELALGKNVLVAFMPWYGYNFEDAIIISEKLIREDAYTSIYIEEFELTARDTKLGKEEITRDIPNVSEEALANLGEDGIVRIGAEVKPGDILVGKITPKSETELAPEERLLRAIFGEKAADVKDASLTVPPGTEGVVMDIKVFSRRDRLSKTDDELVEEALHLKDLQKNYKNRLAVIKMESREKLGALLLNEKVPATVIHRRTAEILLEEGEIFTQELIERVEKEQLIDLIMPSLEIYDVLRSLLREYEILLQQVETDYRTEVEQIRKGDTDLDHGVIRQVKVYVASKRKLQVGDKMAGRHGNKGVVSKIVPEADMPYLPNGETVEIILNPLGVPSRMNVGQVLETHLGYAAKKAGIHVKSPVFEGFPESVIWTMMGEQNLPIDGKSFLYDGRNGERFDNRVVIGYIYIMKLSHLIADKIHARSIGPYSLVTQQPLGGKAQMGGQRFGEMEVWALEAYGAANVLQEILTVKSDDVAGRTRIYESIVKGENLLQTGTPESFNVLIKEMQGLGLDVQTKMVEV